MNNVYLTNQTYINDEQADIAIAYTIARILYSKYGLCNYKRNKNGDLNLPDSFIILVGDYWKNSDLMTYEFIEAILDDSNDLNISFLSDLEREDLA